MAIVKSATAQYQGLGKSGKGSVSTQSGVLNEQPYGFNTRFEDQKGTNPEELLAASHASCFTMALAFMLEAEGHTEGKLQTSADITLEKEGEDFKIAKSELRLMAKVPNIDKATFEEIANKAKEGCPISKLMNAPITLKTEFSS